MKTQIKVDWIKKRKRKKKQTETVDKSWQTKADSPVKKRGERTHIGLNPNLTQMLISPLHLSLLTMPIKSVQNSCWTTSNKSHVVFVFSHSKINSTSPVLSHSLTRCKVQIVQYFIQLNNRLHGLLCQVCLKRQHRMTHLPRKWKQHAGS